MHVPRPSFCTISYFLRTWRSISSLMAQSSLPATTTTTTTTTTTNNNGIININNNNTNNDNHNYHNNVVAARVPLLNTEKQRARVCPCPGAS